MNVGSISRATRGPLALMIVAALSPAIASCAPSGPKDPTVRQEFVMDTAVMVTLYSANAEKVADKVFSRFKDIDRSVRVQSPDSEAWKINDRAGKESVVLSDDAFNVAELAAELAQLSEGAFDPTIGPLTSLWNIEGDDPHVPTGQELSELLPLVNWKDFVVDKSARTAFLKRPGMRVDFGGVAKGYAARVAVDICREARVKSGLVNLGDSSIIAIGKKPNGKKWRVGIQSPEIVDGTVERGKLLGVIECEDAVIQSSGVYERFFVRDGVRYHHILDPKTGFPVENGLAQVSLVLPGDYRYADGLSTTIFVLGPEAGLRLVESIPGAAGLLITSDRRILLSSRAEKMFSLSDDRYAVVVPGKSK